MVNSGRGGLQPEGIFMSLDAPYLCGIESEPRGQAIGAVEPPSTCINGPAGINPSQRLLVSMTSGHSSWLLLSLEVGKSCLRGHPKPANEGHLKTGQR